MGCFDIAPFEHRVDQLKTVELPLDRRVSELLSAETNQSRGHKAIAVFNDLFGVKLACVRPVLLDELPIALDIEVREYTDGVLVKVLHVVDKVLSDSLGRAFFVVGRRLVLLPASLLELVEGNHILGGLFEFISFKHFARLDNCCRADELAC